MSHYENKISDVWEAMNLYAPKIVTGKSRMVPMVAVEQIIKKVPDTGSQSFSSHSTPTTLAWYVTETSPWSQFLPPPNPACGRSQLWPLPSAKATAGS